MLGTEKREIGLLDRLFNRGYNGSEGKAIQVLENLFFRKNALQKIQAIAIQLIIN